MSRAFSTCGYASTATITARASSTSAPSKIRAAGDARPETRAIAERFDKLRGRVPFDPLEYITDFELPDKYKLTMRIEGVD